MTLETYFTQEELKWLNDMNNKLKLQHDAKNLVSLSDRIASFCKFVFYLSPFGYCYDNNRAKLYYSLWINRKNYLS